MPPLKAIFFDLDETLCDDERAMREAIVATARRAVELRPGIDPDALVRSYRQASSRIWDDFVLGSMRESLEDLRLCCWRGGLSGCGLEDDSLAGLLADHYGVVRRSSYRLFPDAADPFLGNLAQRYRLALITNGCGDGQRQKLEASGITHRFHHLLISQELGFAKPDPRIFAEALALIGCEPQEAVMVGDSLQADIAGGRRVGLGTVWINRRGAAQPSPEERADAEIRSLAELEEALRGLGAGR